MAGRTVWSLINTCHTWALCGESDSAKVHYKCPFTLLLFLQVRESARRWMAEIVTRRSRRELPDTGAPCTTNAMPRRLRAARPSCDKSMLRWRAIAADTGVISSSPTEPTTSSFSTNTNWTRRHGNNTLTVEEFHSFMGSKPKHLIKAKTMRNFTSISSNYHPWEWKTENWRVAGFLTGHGILFTQRSVNDLCSE